MLKSSNIILIVIISLLILYLIVDRQQPSPVQKDKDEKFSAVRAQPIYKYKYRNKIGESQMNELLDDVMSWGSAESDVVKASLNPNMLDIQFHNDYRDVLTAINNLVADRRQRFNLANIPLKYSEPETDEVKLMVSDFVAALNDNVSKEVPASRNSNSGWDEAVADPTVEETGWERSQKALGLPTSLYGKPAGRSRIMLVAIEYVQKYETEDEIKYVITIVLQKVGVEDQMVIQASFVIDKRPLRDENNFFETHNVDLKVVIEDIFIKGFLSNDGPDATKQAATLDEKYYNYDTLEINNLTDPKDIQRILMEKYKIRTQEMQQRNAMLDEEGREFHRTLPHIYDFDNIKGTRSIYDDFNKPKVFE